MSHHHTHIHYHQPESSIEKRILDVVTEILKEVKKKMLTDKDILNKLTDLNSEITDIGSIEGSIEKMVTDQAAHISDLASQLAANARDPETVTKIAGLFQSSADQLVANKAALTAAILAGTPADPAATTVTAVGDASTTVTPDTTATPANPTV